jgi:hypothetical protein
VPLRDELARLLLRNLSENREDPDGFDSEKFDRDRKAKPVELQKYYLDLSIVVDSQEKASIIAKEHKQEGVYDLEAGRTIIVKPEEERRKSYLRDASSPEGQEPGGEGGTQAGAEGALPELDSDEEVGKGSAASGHWGHESVEGQHGGSAPGIGSVADELKGHKKWLKLRGAKLVGPEAAREIRTAKEKLSRFHKIRVSKSEGVGIASELAVHQALAQMPAPVRRALKDMGVSVEIKNSRTENQPVFEIGGQTFVQTGQASYINGTITIWGHPEVTDEDRVRLHERASDVASHEIGHFVVQSIMARAADEQARAEKAEDDHHRMLERVRDRQRDFRVRTGREPNTGDDPELDRLEAVREKLFAAREAAEKGEIRGLVRAFDEATLDEGGVTEYSHSYVKATKGPSETRPRNDIWESTDPELRTPFHQRSGTGGRAYITRAANENFAEIVAKGMFPAGVGGSEPMSQRLRMKLFAQNLPRTMKAFKRLWAVAKRSDRIPSHFRAI